MIYLLLQNSFFLLNIDTLLATNEIESSTSAKCESVYLFVNKECFLSPETVNLSNVKFLGYNERERNWSAGVHFGWSIIHHWGIFSLLVPRNYHHIDRYLMCVDLRYMPAHNFFDSLLTTLCLLCCASGEEENKQHNFPIIHILCARRTKVGKLTRLTLDCGQ